MPKLRFWIQANWTGTCGKTNDSRNGVHGHLQEFMILPTGASSFSGAMEWDLRLTITWRLPLKLKRRGVVDISLSVNDFPVAVVENSLR